MRTGCIPLYESLGFKALWGINDYSARVEMGSWHELGICHVPKPGVGASGLHLLTLTSGPSWGPFLLAVSFLTKDHIFLFLCMSREILIVYWMLCVCGML